MDIPALSMGLAQSNVMNQVGAAVLSMTMDTMEQQGSMLLELMGASAQEMALSVNPNLGANIDITL